MREQVPHLRKRLYPAKIIVFEQFGPELFDLVSYPTRHLSRHERRDKSVGPFPDVSAHISKRCRNAEPLKGFDPGLRIRATLSISVPSMSKITAFNTSLPYCEESPARSFPLRGVPSIRTSYCALHSSRFREVNRERPPGRYEVAGQHPISQAASTGGDAAGSSTREEVGS